MSRAQKERLWLKNPYCHWCGCLTVLLPPESKRKYFPSNMATIDHVRSRLHPARREPVYGEERRHVLACRQCNQRRCDEEQKQLSIEELRRRSQLSPRRLRLCETSAEG